jgi:Tol biopolymer transport system component/DNA-binding winged helix-turn-helix (wHTH) protein
MAEKSLRLLITEESGHSPRFYEFDTFRLDAGARLLWRGDETVPLMPKAFDVLLALVCRHGQVVTKDELLAGVWRDAVVEENSLNVNVSALRKVFGERPHEHRFIVTVPGVGYKFVADVREVFDDEIEDVLQEHEATPTDAAPDVNTPSNAENFSSDTKRHKIFSDIKRHRTGVIVGSLVFLLVLGVVYAIRHGIVLPPPPPPVVHFQNVKITPLTNEGTLGSVTISPDGKYIAYVSFEDGKAGLWTKHLATGSRVQIVAPGDATEMRVDTFSHDGNYVLYTVSGGQNPQGATYQVPVLGGASRKILTNVEVESGAIFSPDDKQIAFGRRRNEPREDEYLTASADGTNERTLITLRHLARREGGAGLWIPFDGASWSPDGKTIALGYGDEELHLFVGSISVADGTLKPLSRKYWAQVGKVVWLNDSSGFVIVAREQWLANYPSQIWRVSYPGGEVQRITNDLASYEPRSLSLTADASALVALQEHKTSGIWLAPSGDVGRARDISTRRSAREGIKGLTWDSDGRLIYASSANKPEIWTADANGGNPKMLMEGDDIGVLARFWPDNRHLFFNSNRSGNWQVWRTNLDGSDAKQLTDAPGWGVYNMEISPNGLTIIYADFDLNLWKASTDGGTPVKLSDTASLRPCISPDGKLLAFEYEDEQKHQQLKVIPLDGDGDGSLSKSFDPPAPIFNEALGWSPDGRALVYVLTKGDVSNLWQQPLDGGAPKQITNFNSGRIWSFAYSRDGRQLALARGEMTRDAVLISDEK